MANQITDANFDTLVLKEEGAVLIDFWAPWCGPCRAISPIIDELSEEYEGKVKIYKMNVDENTNTPAKYAIRAIPTIMVFKNGELVEQLVGGVGKDQLQTVLNKAIA